MKEIFQILSYHNALQVRDRFEQLKNKLLPSLSALVFASQVCLKNVEFDKYLYAAGDNSKFGNERRQVFIWKKCERAPFACCEITRKYEESSSITNVCRDEYLIYSESNDRLFAWIPNEDVSNNKCEIVSTL